MIKVEPYLIFDGNARQAIDFYAKVFEAAETKCQTYEEDYEKTKEQNIDQTELDPEWKDKIYFGSIALSNGTRIMIADRKPNEEYIKGDNMAISLDFFMSDHMLKVYELLKEHGNVEKQVIKTFWNAQFAVIKDQFGIRWYLNCQLND